MSMRILIATPLYPPDVGGPATYAAGLEAALVRCGHKPVILNYRDVLSFPSGIRQVVYMWKVVVAAHNVDAVIALDTLSVGLPAMGAARLFCIPGIVRVAGE